MMIRQYLSKHKIFFVLILGLILITGLICSRRAAKGSNDFDTFFYAGRAVYTDASIYYKGPYYQQGTEVSPFLYSPFAAIYFSLFSWLKIKQAAFLWNFFNIVLVFFTFYLLSKILNFQWKRFAKEAKDAPLGKKTMGIGYIFFCTFILLDNLIMAQMNLSVFACCLLGLYFFLKQKKMLSGLLFAVAILLKMTPALFIVYFLCKRQWKLLISLLVGLIIFTAIIPTLIFGAEKNRILHRQWVGRTLKPLYIIFKSKFIEEETHPQKKNATLIKNDQLSSQLTAKNQSLSATLTRLFLQNRNQRAYDPELPIYAAQKYNRLPVLFGGTSEETLTYAVRGLQLVILLILVLIAFRSRDNDFSSLRMEELSLFFLSLTLLAPWARSHQAVSWIFTLTWILSICFSTQAKKDSFEILFRGAVISFVLYMMQSLPYGKAAGFGTWANLSLWFSGVLFILRDPVLLKKEED